MSQALNSRLSFEPVRSLAAAGVGASYTAIGSALSHPLRQIVIQNLTDALVMFSYNTLVGDTLPLAPGDKWVQDISANSTHQSDFFLGSGSVISVKRIDTPTTGSVYVTVFYAEGINV